MKGFEGLGQPKSISKTESNLKSHLFRMAKTYSIISSTMSVKGTTIKKEEAQIWHSFLLLEYIMIPNVLCEFAKSR